MKIVFNIKFVAETSKIKKKSENIKPDVKAIWSHESSIFFYASGSYETNFKTKTATLQSL